MQGQGIGTRASGSPAIQQAHWPKMKRSIDLVDFSPASPSPRVQSSMELATTLHRQPDEVKEAYHALNDCVLCHGLDIDEAYSRREGRRYGRLTTLQQEYSIQDSAMRGCLHCDLIERGVRLCGGAVDLTRPSHMIFEAGLPLRFEPTDVEFYVHAGKMRPNRRTPNDRH